MEDGAGFLQFAAVRCVVPGHGEDGHPADGVAVFVEDTAGDGTVGHEANYEIGFAIAGVEQDGVGLMRGIFGAEDEVGAAIAADGELIIAGIDVGEFEFTGCVGGDGVGGDGDGVGVHAQGETGLAQGLAGHCVEDLAFEAGFGRVLGRGLRGLREEHEGERVRGRPTS